MLAKHTERLARDVVRVGDREHEIAALRAGHATDPRELLRREELRDLRLDRLAGERELRQAFGALALGDRGEVVDPLARRLRLSRHADRAHDALMVDRLAEDLEPARA